MNKQIKKPVKKLKNSAKTRPKKATAIKIVHAKKPVIRHLKLIEHKHTAKLLHIRHTSYVGLMGILVILGFFLVISQNITKADNAVTVSTVVQAPPPNSGAQITAPINGFSIVNINPTAVSGTCAADTFVVVYNDAILSSSALCSSSGKFGLSVQLHAGKNVLTARNFDGINQPGPATDSVTINFTPVKPTTEVVTPTIPDSPLVIPGVTKGSADCADYQPTRTLTTGGEPHVAVVCVPREVETAQDHNIGVLVWGGQPPYALNFKWGDGASTLISMDKPGYRSLAVKYASSGVYNINVQLTDHVEKAATGNSAVQVSAPTTTQPFTQVLTNVFGPSSSWFETPVPLYVTAVALTLGFWGGDIFHRRFGAKKRVHRRRAT